MVSEPSDGQKRYLHLIFVRHGERGDFVFAKTNAQATAPYFSETEHDTHLTQNGWSQAD